MNQSLFLHIVERLESFLGKLPASIQKPILHELTPLKELFLKQRTPRFVLTGSNKWPIQEVVATLFASEHPNNLRDVLMEIFHWQEVNVGGHGSIELLDARGADEAAMGKIAEELSRQGGDIFFHLAEGGSPRPVLARDLDRLVTFLKRNDAAQGQGKVIGIVLHGGTPLPRRSSEKATADRVDAASKLKTVLGEKQGVGERLLHIAELDAVSLEFPVDEESLSARRLMALLAQELPNEARVEMTRISRDRAAQARIAQVLVKSTTAISTAIGAQPIPLADLPILTTLQLVMVSGIMYISGRERSLRAATEFVAALGAGVGAGMVLREGTRALLKFFPGWGNVVCGMVAGAGTYALGRAASVYFLEGVSLKDARRIYLKSRRKPEHPRLPATEVPAKTRRQ